MEIPTTKAPIEHLFNTQLLDQEEALNYAVSYGQGKGWELVAVIWDSVDENKHHIFKIIHMDK